MSTNISNLKLTVLLAVAINMFVYTPSVAQPGFMITTTDGETYFASEYKAFKDVIEYTDQDGYIGIISRKSFADIENLNDLDEAYRQHLDIITKAEEGVSAAVAVSSETEIYENLCKTLIKTGNALENKDVITANMIEELTSAVDGAGSVNMEDKKLSVYVYKQIEALNLASRINNKKGEYLYKLKDHDASSRSLTTAQFCLALAVKLILEDHFTRENISFNHIEVSDEGCFGTENDRQVMLTTQGNNLEIKTACTEKWGTDYMMIEHCVKTQEQAKTNLSRHDGPILDECRNKWETDYRMIEHCVKTQEQAKINLSRHNGHILDECRSKWGTDYRMIEYCVKTQTEAKNNLRY